VFSKESAVMLLPVIVLYEGIWWKERRQARGLLLGSIAMLIPIEAMLYQRGAVLWSSLPTTFPFYDNPIVGTGWLVGKATAVTVMGKYLGLLIWPAKLSADYSWSQIPLGPGWAALWCLPAACILVFLRRNRTVLFLAGSAFLLFLPTSNLLFPIGTIMAERFLYLPSIAFAAAVVAAVYAAETRVRAPWFVPGVLGLIVLACAARTWVRNTDWHDDVSIGKAAVEAAPNSFKSHKLLAYALHEVDPSHANIASVIDSAEKGLQPLKLLPDLRNNADSYLRTGGYYAERGELLRTSDPGGSNAAYRRALELLLRCRAIATAESSGAPDPARFGPLMLRISEAHRRLGESSQALAAAIEGRSFEPGNAEIHHQIAATLLDQGRADEAASSLMEGVLVTADTGLRNELLRLYQGGLDRSGCATMPIQGNTALNPACEIVHRHLCVAAAGTIRLRLETGRRDLAETMRQTALKEFHCQPESLEADSAK
jgi:tetratricopeptide (TPR) repeat protein